MNHSITEMKFKFDSGVVFDWCVPPNQFVFIYSAIENVNPSSQRSSYQQITYASSISRHTTFSSRFPAHRPFIIQLLKFALLLQLYYTNRKRPKKQRVGSQHTQFRCLRLFYSLPINLPMRTYDICTQARDTIK